MRWCFFSFSLVRGGEGGLEVKMNGRIPICENMFSNENGYLETMCAVC